MNIELNTVYNCDCLELMKEMLKWGIVADWLITDPPYGIGEKRLLVGEEYVKIAFILKLNGIIKE